MASYLTPRQVAERWSCSDRKVQRLAQTGELPAMRLGSEWRISLAALEAYEVLHANTPADSGFSPSNEAPKTEVRGAPENPRYPHLWGLEPAPLAGKRKTASVRG